MGKAIIIPNVDYSELNLGKVTKKSGLKLESISIVCDNVVLGSTELTVIYDPAGVDPDKKGVTYSITTGGEYASLNDNILTVNSNIIGKKVTILATSTYDNTITDTKEIEVYSADSDLTVFLDGANNGDVSGQWENLADSTNPFYLDNCVFESGNNYLQLSGTGVDGYQQGAYSNKNPLPVGYGDVTLMFVCYLIREYNTNQYTDSIHFLGMNNIVKGAVQTGRWSWGIMKSNDNYYIWCNDGTTQPNVSYSGFVPNTNQNYIFHITRSSNNILKFYVNGQLINTSTFNKKLITSTNNTGLLVGYNCPVGAGAKNAFKGKVYCAKTWKRVLSDNEILEEFNTVNNKYNLNITNS